MMLRNTSFSKTLLLTTALWPLGLTEGLAQSVAPSTSPSSSVVLPQIDVVATSPLPGAGEAASKIPAQIHSVDAEEFARTRSQNVTDTIQEHVPAAVSIDVNGNAFSQDLRFRGFAASPVQGTPQGLAVYQNGIRVNEAFGDTVNFDLISPQAIYRADLFTNNPVFGLNALGGALSLQMKNGYLWQGFETQVLAGSYGRVSGLFEYGKQSGDYSLYVTGDATRDGGWRYFSPSTLFRLYGDVGYRSQDSEIHFIATGARNTLGVVGPTPLGLLANDNRSVFTSPQTTQNEAGSMAFTGTFNLDHGWSVQSNFYLRSFNQRHTDGNDAEFEDCDEETGFEGQLCMDDDDFPTANGPASLVLLDQNGQSIPFAGENVSYGTIDRTRTRALTAGLTLQAANNGKIFGHDNYLTFGGSVDRSAITFNSNSTLGAIDPQLVVRTNNSLPGAGAQIHSLGQIGYVPTSLDGNTTYYGVYVLDTFNITPDLALTGGARLNIANISTRDDTGLAPELDINAAYTRINPVVGLTYALLPGLTAYGGYSEANRAPTPLELNCADPTRPCLLENSLVADPPLSQVVARTIEAGLRGNAAPLPGAAIDWQAGYFRTESSNDILALASTITGRGYFTNVPATLRQGLEASAQLRFGHFTAYANYAFVDATYQFSGAIASPNNPFADENGTIFVSPGKHIPGIPRHLVKFGGDYAFTPQFKLGGDILIVGSQYFVGDESNQNPQLPAYWVANCHASYDVNDNIQFFGLINNLFNTRNATFGTFFERGTSAQLATSVPFASDPRTVTPLQPLSLYGGVKVTF
jgi:iron complex outermembrane receptor protein